MGQILQMVPADYSEKCVRQKFSWWKKKYENLFIIITPWEWFHTELYTRVLYLMILTDMKILDTVYCKAALGITLHAMRQHSPCPGDPRGRVGLVSHEQPEGWIVESMHFHGPNVVICKVVSGNQ